MNATESKLIIELLRRRADTGDKVIAEAIGHDISKVSKMFGAAEEGVKLRELEAFLNALGLKVVDKTSVTLEQQEIDSIRYLAGKYICTDKSKGGA